MLCVFIHHKIAPPTPGCTKSSNSSSWNICPWLVRIAACLCKLFKVQRDNCLVMVSACQCTPFKFLRQNYNAETLGWLRTPLCPWYSLKHKGLPTHGCSGSQTLGNAWGRFEEVLCFCFGKSRSSAWGHGHLEHEVNDKIWQ